MAFAEVKVFSVRQCWVAARSRTRKADNLLERSIMFTRLSACVSLALFATYSSAWLPAAPITAAPRRELFARRSTSLFLTPRDIARMNGGSNNEEEEEAAAAARAARETLERMWTSQPLEEGEDPGVVGLPELEGEMADGDGAQVGA